MKGIIGKKIGMTSIFQEDGKQTACTIIEAGPCTVTQVKTQETDGYTALQLAFGDKKDKHATKAELNHYAKAQTSAKKFVKEFRNYSIEKQCNALSLIFKEVHDRIGTQMLVAIGHAIKPETISLLGDRKALLNALRHITYELIHDLPASKQSAPRSDLRKKAIKFRLNLLKRKAA